MRRPRCARRAAALGHSHTLAACPVCVSLAFQLAALPAASAAAALHARPTEQPRCPLAPAPTDSMTSAAEFASMGPLLQRVRSLRRSLLQTPTCRAQMLAHNNLGIYLKSAPPCAHTLCLQYFGASPGKQAASTAVNAFKQAVSAAAAPPAAASPAKATTAAIHGELIVRLECTELQQVQLFSFSLPRPCSHSRVPARSCHQVGVAQAHRPLPSSLHHAHAPAQLCPGHHADAHAFQPHQQALLNGLQACACLRVP